MQNLLLNHKNTIVSIIKNFLFFLTVVLLTNWLGGNFTSDCSDVSIYSTAYTNNSNYNSTHDNNIGSDNNNAYSPLDQFIIRDYLNFYFNIGYNMKFLFTNMSFYLIVSHNF